LITQLVLVLNYRLEPRECWFWEKSANDILESWYGYKYTQCNCNLFWL